MYKISLLSCYSFCRRLRAKIISYNYYVKKILSVSGRFMLNLKRSYYSNNLSIID